MAAIANLRILACVVLAAVITAGCAAQPTLPPKSAAVPPDVDLSGSWRLQHPDGAPGENTVSDDRRIYIPSEAAIRRPDHTRSGRRATQPSARLFLENGSALKVTQTPHGLFISFDRAVVEEYTFGENRVVAIGPVEAQRVSGWEGRSFVVETLDERGYVLTEGWRLADGGNTLVREISMARRGKQISSSQQRFARERP